MNQIVALIFFSCVIFMAGCSEGTNPQVINAIPIIVDDSLFIAATTTPQAELSIENGVIQQDLLKLSVSFLGGCEQHEFRLFASKGIAKSNPPIGHVKLTHDANNDSCKEERVEELHFNLSPYREYLQLGLLRSGLIKLPFEGLAEPLSYEF